jgi:DNA polymerase III alpha subunit
MSELIEFASIHNHSNFSDGGESPTRLVKEAAKREIHTFAISDHWTVGGQLEALREADRINDLAGNRTINVFVAEEIGCRASCGSVDLHALFPRREDGLRYVSGHRGYTTQPDVESTVHRIMGFGGIVTVLHPGERLVHGMPLDLTERFLDRFAHQYHHRIWLEGINWQTRLFPGRLQVESKVQQLAETYGVGCVYSSDAHTMKSIRNVMTGYPIGMDFVEAVNLRKVRPIVRRRLPLMDTVDLMFSAFAAQYNTYAVNPKFLVPL